MTRRRIDLLVTLALGLLMVPLLAEVQTPPKIPRLGILEDSPHWRAFRQGLRDLGYVEGQNMVLEWRVAEGHPDRLAAAAAELVQLPVDILVTFGTPATRAAMHATPTIPIVMVSGGDPVRTGIVASLARPGGNVTGSSTMGPDLGAKQLQVLREGVPTMARVTFLWNPLNAALVLWYEDLRDTAWELGVTLHSAEVRHPHEFEGAFAAMLRERPDALIMTGDSMHQLHVERILAFAAQNRLPVMSNVKANVPAGALLSYGPSWPELFQWAAQYVDKILKGAKPGDLPVRQPSTFELVINLKTAQALGLTIPPTLLFQANEVIR
jgi:putative tryptophan/tyrosine transport system substrate-binding protein